MTINILHQETYSRGELLLRSFFGFIYIMIPHAFVLLFLALGGIFVNLISWWAILITGKFPRGLFDYTVKLNRYGLRLQARLLNLADGYPAFGLNAQDDKVVYEVEYPETSSRVQLLLKTFFGIFYVYIPHFFCLLFIGLAAQFAMFIAWWAVLITGKYPKGLFDFVVGYIRWNGRVGAYMANLTETYPPFSLS